MHISRDVRVVLCHMLLLSTKKKENSNEMDVGHSPNHPELDRTRSRPAPSKVSLFTLRAFVRPHFGQPATCKFKCVVRRFIVDPCRACCIVSTPESGHRSEQALEPREIKRSRMRHISTTPATFRSIPSTFRVGRQSAPATQRNCRELGRSGDPRGKWQRQSGKPSFG